MAENSKIEWTDHTFNPWIGCAKVSAGCANCYAETLMDKRMGKVKWGPHGTRTRTSTANWRKPLAWNRKAKAEGRRYRVFCASLADILEDFPGLDDIRIDLWDLIYQTPHLDWLILTKRPERAALVFPSAWMNGDWPANVQIGASVENQQTANERTPHLLRIPARVRFLSMEPLLGPVEIGFGAVMPGRWHWLDSDSLHWVIVGGESGRNARPMHPDWARSIRDQCVAAGVAFYFKQWGEWAETPGYTYTTPRAGMTGPWELASGATEYLIGDGLDIQHRHLRKVGKAAAGRLLDGRTWDQFPEATPCD